MSDRSPHTRPEFVVTAPKTTNEGAWEGFATQGSYATNNVENPAENPTAAMRSHRKPARFKVPAWRGSNSVRAAGLVIAAVVGVAAIVYFVMPSSHSDRSNANGGTATGGQMGRPGPLPGAPSTEGKGGSKSAAPNGPKPLKPTDPAQVKSWEAGSGGKALTQVTAQSGSVLMAHAGSQYPEMLQYCNALTTAVQTAEADSPIPDNAMQKMYAKSLTAFKMGAADCVAGITQHPEGVEDTVTSVNHAEINKAVSELSLGMNDLYIATEVLRKS
jgi:hypothetical protein